MLIVISDPAPAANGAACINRLFGAGLQFFHLRKPGADEALIRDLVNDIDPEYRQRIALHQHHQLSDELGLKRLHYTATHWQQADEKALQALSNEGFILSASVHSMEEYKKLSSAFSYAFISPVFDSISKPGYKAMKAPEIKKKERTIKLIALGGIDENNCTDERLKNYDGIALLGAIWQSSHPAKAFEKIKRQWHTTGR